MTNVDVSGSSMLAERKQKEGRHGYRLPKDSLSPREEAVCRLLVDGLQLKEVAFQLEISYHTAEIHKRNAYQKMGIHSRGEMFKYFNGGQAADGRVDTLGAELASIHARLGLVESKLLDVIQQRFSTQERSSE